MKDRKIKCNAALRAEDLSRYCELGKQEKLLMERAFSLMELTARGYHRILKTARTIADLDGEERIRETHPAGSVEFEDDRREVLEEVSDLIYEFWVCRITGRCGAEENMSERVHENS